MGRKQYRSVHRNTQTFSRPSRDNFQRNLSVPKRRTESKRVTKPLDDGRPPGAAEREQRSKSPHTADKLSSLADVFNTDFEGDAVSFPPADKSSSLVDLFNTDHGEDVLPFPNHSAEDDTHEDTGDSDEAVIDEAIIFPPPVPQTSVASRLRQGVQAWKTTNSLLAAILSRGTNPFSRLQYETVCRITAPLLRSLELDVLPAYSTLLRNVYPFIQSHCLPQVTISSRTHPQNPSPAKSCSFVPPSQWALFDIGNYAFFRAVYDRERLDDPLSFNNSPFMRQRRRFLDDTSQLFIPHDSSFTTAVTGDRVTIVLENTPSTTVPDLTFDVAGASLTATIRSLFIGSTINGTKSSFLRDGDITAELATASGSSTESTSIWYLTHRFWATEAAVGRRFLFRATGDSADSYSVFSVRVVSSRAHQEAPPRLNRGVCSDGKPYVMYRFIIFHDNFHVSRSMNRQESVGGVYLLPMDLPSYMKIHPSSARTISLTPHGTSSADALELVEDDLVRGVSSGIEGIDPLGRPLRIYLDLCGLLADFHEANDGLATLNHGGNAGCNMCTFRQNTSQYNTRSKHAYNVRAHSRNSGYQRTTWRYNAVHSAGMSNDDANFLGLKPKSSLSSNDTLRMRLESRMTAAPSSPAFEHTIFPFKAFQCSIVAPDHLLSGNIKNILNAVFHALPDNNARSLLDKSFVAVLPRAGLYPQPKIYNFDGKHVRSCSFSILFSIFTVAPYVLYNYLSTADTPPAQDLRDIVDLLYLLFEIVNKIRFFPSADRGEAYQVARMFGQSRGDYFRTLQRLVATYLRRVDQLVSASNASADILDKPNLHRLLELVVHTIPMYGHAHNISDLTFEHKHQSLKRAHHRANNHEKSNHHFSVRAELFDVWRARVTGAYYRLSSSESTEEVTVAARQELYKLVFGVSAVELDTPSNREFLPSVDRMLKGLFNPSLCNIAPVAPLRSSCQAR